MRKLALLSLGLGLLLAGCAGDGADPGRGGDVVEIAGTDIELPALPKVDTKAQLADLLAGKTIVQTPLIVDDELFLQFEVDGTNVYAQLDIDKGDVEGQAIKPTAQKVEVQLTHVEDVEKVALASVDALMDRLGGKDGEPIKVHAAQARMVVRGIDTGVSPSEFPIGVSFLTPLYAPNGSCVEHWWWDACTKETNNQPCTFVAQIPCHGWTWTAQQIQVTCEDGTVKPSISYVLQSTDYFATLQVNGACGYLDFSIWDSNSDGCYCVVNQQPNCPAVPPPPPPAPPANPCGKKCTPKAQANEDGAIEVICDDDGDVPTLPPTEPTPIDPLPTLDTTLDTTLHTEEPITPN
jgi:hypothetical protein